MYNRLRILLVLTCLTIGTTIPAYANDGPIKIACVGDSITFGSGVQNREVNAYPQVLDRAFGESVKVMNFGRSGATLLKNGDHPYWKTDQFRQATEFQPDIVIIKLGSNDSKPHNWEKKDEYAPDLIAMVEHFRSLESRPTIYLCKPVPVPKAAFGITEEIVGGEVVPLVAQVAKQTKCRVIDLYSALLDTPEHIPDGVHPNAAGAAKMAETVYEAITKRNGKLRK